MHFLRSLIEYFDYDSGFSEWMSNFRVAKTILGLNDRDATRFADLKRQDRANYDKLRED